MFYKGFDINSINFKFNIKEIIQNISDYILDLQIKITSNYNKQIYLFKRKSIHVKPCTLD